MINETARILEAKHPGVQVGTFAYMSLEAPPALTKPRDNVVIQVPRLRHCTVRSVTESPKNAGFRRNLERWCELAPGRVYVWEYGANYESFLVPFPCLYAIADNIKEYHRLGVAGVSVQGNYVSTGGDLAAVKNYVWRKILWDPTLDPRALVREFCEGYYGPAAPAIVEYVEALEEGVRGEPTSSRSRGRFCRSPRAKRFAVPPTGPAGSCRRATPSPAAAWRRPSWASKPSRSRSRCPRKTRSLSRMVDSTAPT
jgi:hypothetical protein